LGVVVIVGGGVVLANYYRALKEFEAYLNVE